MVNSQDLPRSTATGNIISPSENTSVGVEFEFEVTIDSPSQHSYYYAAHEVSGQYWPKARVIPHASGIPYKGQSNEYGHPPGGVFYLVLFEVNLKEHERIQKWLHGTDWPGMQVSGRILDRTRLRLT